MILEDKVTIRTLLLAIGFTISVTFSATLIWTRFLFVEGEIKVMEDRVDYVDNRIDRKFETLEERIRKLEEEIKDGRAR